MSEVLALLGVAPDKVLPDPKVAAIVLDGSGKLLARYTKTKFGEPHSEAQVVLKSFEAILRRRRSELASPTLEKAKSLLKAFRKKLLSPGTIASDDDLSEIRELASLLENPLSSAYLLVNLEPCSHFGKNPACASLVSAAGMGRLHFSHFDPDPDVRGKGYEALRSQGVATSMGCYHRESISHNRLFLAIAWYMPRLFGGIHPTANPKEPPHVMLGLHVPRFEVRTRDLGKTVHVHTFGLPPRRTTLQRVPASGRPMIKPTTFVSVPRNPESVLFTTLLNPPAIVEMIYRRFQEIPGTIVAAVPDMSFELSKEDCIEILREYCPDTPICVGVRMSAIQDKLARISLRRRLMVQKRKEGIVAVVILAKGVPPDQKQKIETRYLELVSATTLHVSRLEEYLIMLKFLRENITATLYLGGDLFAERWRDQTIENLRKLMIGRRNFEIRCTEEEVVAALREAGVPRLGYLEPYWEIV